MEGFVAAVSRRQPEGARAPGRSASGSSAGAWGVRFCASQLNSHRRPNCSVDSVHLDSRSSSGCTWRCTMQRQGLQQACIHGPAKSWRGHVPSDMLQQAVCRALTSRRRQGSINELSGRTTVPMYSASACQHVPPRGLSCWHRGARSTCEHLLSAGKLHPVKVLLQSTAAPRTCTLEIQGIHCGMRCRSSHIAYAASSGTPTSCSALFSSHCAALTRRALPLLHPPASPVPSHRRRMWCRDGASARPVPCTDRHPNVDIMHGSRPLRGMLGDTHGNMASSTCWASFLLLCCPVPPQRAAGTGEGPCT